MRASFDEASGKYIIGLTQKELRDLMIEGRLEGGPYCPHRTHGTFRDKDSNNHRSNGHFLTYKNEYGRHRVQFMTIKVLKKEDD